MIDWEVRNDQLYLNGKYVLIPDGPIRILESREGLFVLSAKTDNPRNVYLIDPSGSIKWTIEIMPDSPTPLGYSYISFEGDKLIGYNIEGIDMIIDRETGKVSDKNTNVRPW